MNLTRIRIMKNARSLRYLVAEEADEKRKYRDELIR